MPFVGLTPMLGVAGVEAAIVFYRDVLGFYKTSEFRHDGPLLWAQMRRDRCELMFSRIRSPEARIEGATGRGQITVYIQLKDEVERLYAKLSESHHKPSPLRVTFYQMKEFDLFHPDGYKLTFGQETEEPPTGE